MIAPCLRRLLHLRFCRGAAVCLLILIALPFTAPFSTYDLRGVVVHTALDEIGAESFADKHVTCATLPAMAAVLVAQPIVRLDLFFVSAIARETRLQAAPLPLRL